MAIITAKSDKGEFLAPPTLAIVIPVLFPQFHACAAVFCLCFVWNRLSRANMKDQMDAKINLLNFISSPEKHITNIHRG